MWEDKNINAFLAVFFTVYAFGFLFHSDPTFAGSLPGHILGIVGTLVIGLTLIYPAKKRFFKSRLKKNDLRNHIAFGLIGPIIVIVHSAHQFASIISTLIFLVLFLVVFSGIIGRFLFKKVNQSLREQKRNHKLLLKHLSSRKKEAFEGRFSESQPDAPTSPAHDMEITTHDAFSPLKEAIQAVIEAEYNIKFFDRSKSLFSKWIRIHYFLSALLFAVTIVHVITTIYYGLRWLP
jgi:hypothetical protein